MCRDAHTTPQPSLRSADLEKERTPISSRPWRSGLSPPVGEGHELTNGRAPCATFVLANRYEIRFDDDCEAPASESGVDGDDDEYSAFAKIVVNFVIGGAPYDVNLRYVGYVYISPGIAGLRGRVRGDLRAPSAYRVCILNQLCRVLPHAAHVRVQAG